MIIWSVFLLFSPRTKPDCIICDINMVERIEMWLMWARWQSPGLSSSHTGTVWRADFPSTRPPGCARTSTWTSSAWKRTAWKRWRLPQIHSQRQTCSLKWWATKFREKFRISSLYSERRKQIWQYHLPPNKEANWLFKHKHKLVDHKANWIRVHIRALIAASCNDNLRWCPKCCLVVMSCINMFHSNEKKKKKRWEKEKVDM